MKILHVLTAPRAEGTPKLVLDWLSVKDHNQELLFLSSVGELKTQFNDTGAWQYYNDEFVLGLKNAHKIVTLVRRICRDRKPDIVISWPMGFSQWIHLGAKLGGVHKLIVHAGNPPGKSFIDRYIYTYMSFWSGFFLKSKVIACSEYIRTEFMRIPFLSEKQFYSVYNCFQPNKFSFDRSLQQNKNASMVATLEKHKDHATLLRAWQIIERKALGYQLKLIGDGRLKNELIRLSDSLNLKQVEFLGSRMDVPDLLRKSNLFILSTTKQEGFGTVLIEALASGCQVIATDVPACREVLQAGKFGKLVPQSDADTLANTILTCYEIPLNEVERNAQIEYASLFSPEKMIKKYLEISVI